MPTYRVIFKKSANGGARTTEMDALDMLHLLSELNIKGHRYDIKSIEEVEA